MQRASEGSNGEERSSDETTLGFFDTKSNLGDEEDELIDVLDFKKLQEDNKHVELLDSKSDQGDNEVNEMIDAQSSKENVLSEGSDEQNKLQEQLPFKVNDDSSRWDNTEDPQLSNERPQDNWPSETNTTLEINVVGSSHLEHQVGTPKDGELGKNCTPESGENANAEILLPSDIICSSKSQPSERRGRGRPWKLNRHGALAVPSPSSAQDSDQQRQEDIEAFRPETGDKVVARRGRGRGRPRIVKQDQISTSGTLSHSKHLDHQHSLVKRGSGRPLKRKFDADVLSKDFWTSKNEQQEPKRRGRGRPPKVI